jgi:glycosyl transferase family 25
MDATPPLTVLVINLDNRPDRWLVIQRMCRQCGIHAERVSAVRKSPGWKGCALSHQKCAQIAKERRLPWVLVLEDDCTFSVDEWQRFQQLLPYLWQHRSSWEMFNGGITSIKNIDLMEPSIPLLRANGFATHFILYNFRALNTILQWTEANEQIDVYFDRNFKYVTTFPLIARQLPSHSDIENGNTDYSGLFDKTETEMKGFLRNYLLEKQGL